MRKILLVSAVALMILQGAKAQVFHQVLNGGFEEWETVSGTFKEPYHWNSFKTASGSLASFVSNQIVESSDVRPGSSGSKSIKTWANVLMGIVANGQFTTGRVNAANATPSHADNYNYTAVSDTNFHQRINCRPDSIVFWAKFICPISATQEASMKAILHDSSNVRDPEIATDSAHIVALATQHFTRGTWTRFQTAFAYTRQAIDPVYMLITFSTNKNAGEGAASDTLLVDDVALIYNHGIAILIDGVNLLDFHFDSLRYTYGDTATHINYGGAFPSVSATAVSPNAKVEIVQATTATPEATVRYRHGDIDRTYTIDFTNLVGINRVDVSEKWTIFPNPTSNVVHISGNSIIKEIAITDIFGKTLRRLPVGDTQKAVACDDLPAGTYILQIITEKNSCNYKFIKQ